MFMTTLNPPAFAIDAALLILLYFGAAEYGRTVQVTAMTYLAVFMFVSKFIKNLDHYLHYPEDLLLVPCSILFGWFHGFIKLYALFTINVVSRSLRQRPTS